MAATLLRSALLAGVPGIVHGFSTRQGGASTGAFASCNLSLRVGDERLAVNANRAAALSALGRSDATLVLLKQVHGDGIVEVTQRAGRTIEADGLWTRDRGAVLAVLVADCVPVLMASRDGRAVAAVHAGWRGTAARIVARMVTRLGEAGFAAKDLFVTLGPAIGPCCFAIGEDTAAQLEKAFAGSPAVRRGAPGQAVADLWELNTQALIEAGVPAANIEALRRCTDCTRDELYSHRRDAGQTGRQAGLIALA